MNLNEAIRLATLQCPDKYALSYLHGIPRAIEEEGNRGLNTQLIYALANMSHWRGDNAREVKKVFNRHLKQHKAEEVIA